MTYSDKVNSVVNLVRFFHEKKARWPTHLEVLEYVSVAHSVKRDTALGYIREAFVSRLLIDSKEYISIPKNTT